MDLAAIRRTYRRYAGHYDMVFGPVFHPGRRMAVETANQRPGRRILEVGVGTGLSLPLYRKDIQVTGIDISPEMLAKAREKVAEQQLENVEALLEMDAEALEFEDNSFDVVVAMYVASVVPNPDRLMAEMRRVCVPDGEILIINHFASENPVLRGLERTLKPLSKMLGFHPDMALEALPDEPDCPRVGVHRANIFGYWKLVHYRNGPAANGADVVDSQVGPD